MQTRVNPTRMELTRLKRQIVTARRGHKLLKDKQDELIKKFIDMVKENKKLREEIERDLEMALKLYHGTQPNAPGSPGRKPDDPSARVNIDISKQNIMSVNVKIDVQLEEGSNIYSYGFAGTSGELDSAITILSGMLAKMLKLSEIEKACQLMADEIEKLVAGSMPWVNNDSINGRVYKVYNHET